MPKDAVQTAVAAVARAGGFKGGPRTWRKEVPLGLAVLNLQKSSWGPQYYINFGVYVRALGPLTEPRAEQCHYSARAESTFSASEEWQPERWEDLLNLECVESDEVRQREIEMFLSEDVLPFMEQIGTDAGLRTAFAQGRLTQALMLVLKDYLGRGG
jgi:hypothetical protein